MKKKKNESEEEDKKGHSAHAEDPKEEYREENNFVNLLRKKNPKNVYNGRKRKGKDTESINGEGPAENKKDKPAGVNNFLSPCRSRLY